jgi:RNA methyltransferase, TrmH family
MITSNDNERLKLIRKLRDRKWREREGMFATEGEDLLKAALEAGWEPVAVLVTPGSGIDGTEVEPDLLDGVSALGSGTRVIAVWRIPEEPLESGPAVYLHGVGDPGNVGTIVRTAAALTGSRVILGAGSADPYSPKAVRASMGAIFAIPPGRGRVEDTSGPRIALVAHGGSGLDEAIAAVDGTPTVCLGAERDGLPAVVVDACEATATIPLQPGTESLNVAAAAAIALQRISSTGSRRAGKTDA